MPCPHNEITIVQRSQRQSAVAAAAYQSGEKLFCEYEEEYCSEEHTIPGDVYLIQGDELSEKSCEEIGRASCRERV